MYSESSWRASAQPLADGWRKAGDEQSEWCISRKECSCSLSASAGAEVTHYCILIHLYCPLSERHYLREQQFLILNHIERETKKPNKRKGVHTGSKKIVNERIKCTKLKTFKVQQIC